VTTFVIVSASDIAIGGEVQAYVTEAPNAREALIKVRDDVGPGEYSVIPTSRETLLRVDSVMRYEVRS
jgi:hypothetical protein